MMMVPQNHISMPVRTPEMCFNQFNLTWNSNQGIANILYSAPHHPEWHSRSLPELSPSGSQFVCQKYDGNWFKNDAFDWRRRRGGKLIREDHMKLKLNKEERITANYVHSALVPAFHRRIYQMTDNNEFVLIHYLYVPEKDNEDISPEKMVDQIVGHIKACNQEVDSFNRLLSQLSVILNNTYNPQVITSIAEDVFQRINANGECHDQMPSTSQGVQLERRNSCSSAFRRGLSSMALRRQPSTFSDSVDAHFVGAIMNNCEMNKQPPLYAAEDVQSYSGDTQRSSNPDEDSSVMASLRSASAGAASQASASIQRTGEGPEIIDIAPSSSSTKGGTRILIVGDWYMKGHEYAIIFGDKKVPARLIRPGVLSCVVPPAGTAGVVLLQVLCNDAVASQTRRFLYEDTERDELLQLLVDRLHLIVTAFGLPDSLKNFNGNVLDQDSIAKVLRSLEGLPLMHPSIVSPPAILPCRTILHLSAQLDFHSVINQILILRRSLPYAREFDPVARDADGATPLHYAARNGNVSSARSLLDCCPSAGDVLDDRNRTPADVAVGDQVMSMVARNSGSHEMSPAIDQEVRQQHVTSTALWVMTNGETVTDSHLLKERHLIDEESTSTMSAFQDEMMHSSRSIPSDAPHLEISMDTDVDLPDSPKMADLFKAATSREELTDNNREKMASLAKQIIDALPARIKHDNNSLLDEYCITDTGNIPYPMGNLTHMINAEDYWSMPQGSHQQFNIPMEQEVSPVVSGRASSSSFDSHLRIGGTNSFTSSKSNTFDGSNIDFDKDLGEFFNLSLDGDVDPVQQRLGNLKLNDNEQRELYEAAMVIQRAFREYRERNTFRRQEAERNAAVTIQSCYRRYKQYCYIKQLHSAAIVVQKHFRLKRVNQKEASSSNEVQEHPTLEGQILRIQVPQTSSSLSREHRAATTIQTAYRGHRKRQAAARKIQKFMKESRQKLRRMAEQSGDVSCSATQLQMAAGGNPFQDLGSLRIITENS